MNLADQVCSLELSKRLKELGIKQESIFYYYHNQGELYLSKITGGNDLDGNQIRNDFIPEQFMFSAFTVAELGEMLPRLHATYKEDENNYVCCQFESPSGHRVEEKTEANARAKMLIYLIENNLHSLKEEKDNG